MIFQNNLLPVGEPQPEDSVHIELERGDTGQHDDVADIKLDIADVLSRKQNRVVYVFTGDLWSALRQPENVVKVVCNMHV